MILLFALLSFIIQFLIEGQLFSFTFLFSLLQEKFNLSILQVALIGNIQITLFFATFALYTYFLPEIFQGVHTKTLIGCFFWTCGITGTCVSNSYIQLIISLGFCSGIGSSLLYWASYICLIDILTNKKNKWQYLLLLTLVSLGGTSGDIFFALFVSQYYTSAIASNNFESWQIAYILLGGIGSVFFIFCSLYFKLFANIEPPANNFLQVKNAKNFKTSPIFILFLISIMLSNFAVPVVIIYLVPYMKEFGFEEDAGFSVLLSSVGAIVGSCLACASVITIRKCAPNNNFNFGIAFLHCFGLLLNVTVIFVWLACTSKSSIFAFNFFNGFSVSFSLAIIRTLALEFQKLHQYKKEPVSALFVPVIMFGIVPGSMFAGIIAGALRQHTGSFTMSIVTAGIFQIFAFLFWVICLIVIKLTN